MIRYTVVWHQDAQNQLAQIWIDALNRAAVSQAANAIDVYLATDAHAKGSPVDGDLLELTISPLSILFAVSEADRLVKILYVSVIE